MSAEFAPFDMDGMDGDQDIDNATFTTPAPEVREEWGVRDEDTGKLHPAHDEAQARMWAEEGDVLIRRTVTTTPWVEVES